MARNSEIVRAVMFICAGAMIVILYEHGAKRQKQHSPSSLDENGAAQLEQQSKQEISRAAVAEEKKSTKPVHELEMSKQVANIPAEILDEMLSLNNQKVSHDNPRLLTLIRDYFIHPPSKEPYKLAQPNRTDYAGQGKDNVIPQLLKDSPNNGFFIECGALDGERLSHSLYFEKTKHWSGLLVEADKNSFKQLLRKHRKAYSINACLSSNTYPSVMTYNQLGAIGRLVEDTFDKAYKKHSKGVFNLKQHMIQLQCFPLYSILLALNQLHVDFFLLDIEGMELPILRTIPWDKVNITHILAEYTHSQGGHPSYKSYLEQNGYKFIKVIGEDILVQRK